MTEDLQLAGYSERTIESYMFNLYWRRIIPLSQTRSIAFPFSRLDREPFWELVPQPGTTITPAIINNTSSVTFLRKHALGPSRTKGCFGSCRAARGGGYCCLDLADAEGYTPRNNPNSLHLYAVTCNITYGSNQDEVLHDRP